MGQSNLQHDTLLPPRQFLSQGPRLHAPAKINLNLLVGPLREDGFHPVDSCVAGISLYDPIDLQPRNDGKITLVTEGLSCGPAEENLAYRAALLLAKGRDVPGVEIRLVKNIPPGGGLGGGSSDAASVLRGLNELWDLNLSNERLCAMGASLGSDVPFFLGSPAGRMTGRGEILEPIDVFPFWAVLILPGLACSTAAVYRAFDDQPAPRDEPPPVELLTQPPSDWRDRLVNHLMQPAFAVCPPLAKLHERLTRALPAPVHLTGSGSSLFVLCDAAAEARRIFEAVPADLQPLCKIVRRNSWTSSDDSETIPR
ncbi:MAG: 4-(cytidine 5'-diphospho)-2-C-methyl-D-erythritol kinase [Phycisphaerae bacterium]|nr:4-(cytidine 5'-diphospho)-2-C-methyl-D-erythritol kinase [Phycisphaerae bacterium]